MHDVKYDDHDDVQFFREGEEGKEATHEEQEVVQKEAAPGDEPSSGHEIDSVSMNV